MILAKLFGIAKPTQHDIVQQKRTVILRSLMRKEAQIGGSLFGPVRKGGKREFFCLDKTTWIWHEEWTDDRGVKRVLNTRYDMRPTGILKAQNGQGYQMVSPDEAQNLVKAIDTYLVRVKNEIYQTV